jgi:peptide/nickel transport system permease protein
VIVYVVKRVLIMVPTMLGIMVVIWLVMTLAPGDPAGSQSRASFGADAAEDLSNLERADRNIRMFREQFGLNRPRFWNWWVRLDAEEVREALVVAHDGAAAHGTGAVARARRKLQDWGEYAVPALVGILAETEGALQTFALGWLRKSAYRFKRLLPAGYRPTAAEVEEDRRTDQENERIASEAFGWGPEAPAAARDPAVAAWRAWFEERRAVGEWAYRDGGWAALERRLVDTQFGAYWRNLLQGNLGLSFRTMRPVTEEIGKRLKYSLSLAVPSFILAWILAVFLGVASAANHNSPVDQGIGVTLFMLYSIPSFLAATVLQKIVAVDWGWLPTSGFEDTGARRMNTWDHLWDVVRHLTLPMICYTYGSLAYISRQARSGLLEVLHSDYVRTARAKGLAERTVIWKHAVRNGMMPIVTLLGTALPILLGGSIVIESIFQIDGFGLLMIDSIMQKDYNVVMGIALVSAVLTLVGILIADILYAAMDPRISLD